MEDEGDEPPDSRSRISSLVTRVYDPRIYFSPNGRHTTDKRAIFLQPNGNGKEIGVLNMTYAEHENAPLLAYRVREIREGQESSDIEVNGHRVLPRDDRKEYDRIAREDPRISIIEEDPYISCIGYNGFNAVSFGIRLNKNGKWERVGTTGPNIPLEEAIRLVPKGSPYVEVLEKEFEDTKRRRNDIGETGTIFPYNKDTSIVHMIQMATPLEYLRLGNSIQRISVGKISDLQKPQTWREWFPQIDKHTVLNPSDLDEWANYRIGQGAAPKMVIDRKGRQRWINVIHGVEDTKNTDVNELVYRTTVAEYDPRTGNMASCMKYPFLEPFENDVLIETDPSGKKWKKSICFGNDLVLPENAKRRPEKGLERELMIIMGVADDKGGYYITNLEYVLNKLEEPGNQIRAAA